MEPYGDTRAVSANAAGIAVSREKKDYTMKFPKIALAAAAGSLALAPVAAYAQDDDDGSDIVRAGIIAAIAGIGIAVLLLTDEESDIPISF